MNYQRSDGETITEAVVFAVSKLLDRDPLTLDPLTDTIDPDALEALFDRGEGGNLSVSFVFSGSRVTVKEDGNIEVSRLSGGNS